MKRPLSFITVLTGIIIALSLLQIGVSNYLSTTGVTLGKLQDDIKSYHTENSVLAEKLLVATSYNTIASQAATLGLAETKSAIVLTVPPTVARR